MNYTDTLNLVTTTLTDFGLSVLAIITATIAIGLAYLVFKFGWGRVKTSLNGGSSLAEAYAEADRKYGEW